MAVLPLTRTTHPTPCVTTRRILSSCGKRNLSTYLIEVPDDSLERAGIFEGELVIATPTVLTGWTEGAFRGCLVVAHDAVNTYLGWHLPPRLVRTHDSIPTSDLEIVGLIFGRAL